MNCSPGRAERSALATVSPPKPLSNTTMGENGDMGGALWQKFEKPRCPQRRPRGKTCYNGIPLNSYRTAGGLGLTLPCKPRDAIPLCGDTYERSLEGQTDPIGG